MAQDEQPAPKQQAAPQKSGGGGGDRIARVEAQLVDLQVALGSIESMVRNGGGAAAMQAPAPAPSSYDSGGNSGGAGDGRVTALETQIQALTAQLEQVTQQMAALQSRLGGGSSGMNAPVPGNGGNAPPAQYVPNSYDAPVAGSQLQAAAQPDSGNAASEGRASFDHQASFGQAGEPQREVAQAGMSDPIGGLIGDGDRAAYDDPAAGSGAVAQPPRDLAALPPDAGAGAPVPDPSGASPKEIYDVAYRQLMAREYDSAAASFSQFVSSYPKDPLAGEAQYWLGETYYVRGQHKQAADAFLASYRTYGSGRKAPDSLLKLGLALAQLKEKDAACSALSEFSVKYPSAPEHLRTRATSERRRAGCS